MRSRMERYRNNNEAVSSRSQKNQELYHNLGTNTKYTNFTDVSNLDAVSLSDASKNYRTREGFQQIKKYNNLIDTPKVKKELEDFNYLYQDYENRIYDINSVLEEARKNRIEKDELEAKRRLKNTNYNILAGLDQTELEKYRHRQRREKEIPKDNREDLKELIHTITTKTLAGEISKQTSLDLLSDLIATKVEDEVLSVEKKQDDVDEKLSLSKEILDKDSIKRVEEAKKDTTTTHNLKEVDHSFYTRSMDLSEKDFEMDYEFSDGIQEKKVPTLLKVFLILLLLGALATAVFFIIQSF